MPRRKATAVPSSRRISEPGHRRAPKKPGVSRGKGKPKASNGVSSRPRVKGSAKSSRAPGLIRGNVKPGARFDADGKRIRRWRKGTVAVRAMKKECKKTSTVFTGAGFRRAFRAGFQGQTPRVRPDALHASGDMVQAIMLRLMSSVAMTMAARKVKTVTEDIVRTEFYRLVLLNKWNLEVVRCVEENVVRFCTGSAWCKSLTQKKA